VNDADAKKQQDRETGLSPWTIGLALCGGAAAWVVAELFWRVIQ
jgi:hypothetical protein